MYAETVRTVKELDRLKGKKKKKYIADIIKTISAENEKKFTSAQKYILDKLNEKNKITLLDIYDINQLYGMAIDNWQYIRNQKKGKIA